MGIIVDEARNTLSDSALHSGGGFEVITLDRALRGSGNYLMRKSGISRAVTEITLDQDSSTVDISATESSFLAGHLFEQPFLSSPDFNGLSVISFRNLRQKLQTPASGRPELISFLSPSVAYLYPEPDQEYTLSLPWWQPLTTWTYGDETSETKNTELNIPDQYADEWIWWGARAWMLYGAPDHPDGQAAMERFNQFCEEIAGEAHNDGVWYADLGEETEHVYTPRGGI